MVETPKAAVDARIVYWSIPQAGVSTTLQRIHSKLRPDHRGEPKEIPTRLDPTLSYEVLPIKLGEVSGVDTRIELVAVPGAAEQAPTRKQLLDRADGIVFVADARPERIDENVERFEELRRALAAYGRAIEAVPLVLQLNKRDLSDPGALEELIRKLDAPRAACFETVASEGNGLFQVLSAISKAVVRSLREQPGRARIVVRPAARPAPPPAEWPEPVSLRRPAAAPSTPLHQPVAAQSTPLQRPAAAQSTPLQRPVAAQIAVSPPASVAPEDITGPLRPKPIAAEAVAAPGSSGATLRVVGVGTARCADERTVRVPLQLEDDAGRRFALTLCVAVEDLATPR